MLTKLSTRPPVFFFPVFILLFISQISAGQDTIRPGNTRKDINIDSLNAAGSKKADTATPGQDTLTKSSGKPVKKAKLESKVEYSSKDSLRFEIKQQKVILFNAADIKYQDIELKANYVEINFPENAVFAKGVPDSTGKEQGIPEFRQADQNFRSKVITYNYDTKRGYIQTVFTKQDEGYLHGKVVKKMEDDVTYVKDGAYTTCDDPEHPHYEFRFNKAKVIPGKKVITGPALMAIAEVPTPIVIPFGYFPNRTGQHSGILLPTYGESANRGFYFENLGYYWAINDYMDLKIQGDIYTHGSWAIKPTYTYNYRYHYNGYLNLGYAVNITGSPGTADYNKGTDFRIRWVHSQDSKARPYSKFSANVNIVSQHYNYYNPSSSAEAYLSNEFQSSINYSTQLFNQKAFINLNLNHKENTIQHTFSLSFPQIAFSVNQFYPFRKENRAGKIKWYENISLRYSLDANNIYNAKDSLLFSPGWVDQMNNGMQHTIPISGNVKILKFLNFTGAINLRDRMYIKSIHKSFVHETVAGRDTGFYKTDTIPGFVNGFDGNIGATVNARLYGMYSFKKGAVIAFRHMMTPAISFSYTPDFGAPGWGYWHYIDNDTNTVNPQRYSKFENSLYGGPPQYKSGLLTFSLSNNLEMKIRNRKDTVTGTKKIPLIDDFTIRVSYDLAKDTLRWSPITLSGRSTIVKGLSVQYSSTWDMYAHDANGRRINSTEWKMNNRLLRLDNSSWDASFSYSLASDKLKNKKTSTKGSSAERQDIDDYPEYYVDFNIPWSFSISYSFHWAKNFQQSQNKRVENLTQTLGVTGQLNITPKWKVTMATGWDFTNNQLAYTRIDLYRDLHCWEMRFGWIPKGGRQSWDFSINVKASILQDLKLNKKKDFRDFAD